VPGCVIEARTYRIGFACHNFWALRRAEAESALGELHGLATSRVTGRIVPIGTTAEHALRVYVFAHDAEYAVRLGVPVKSTRMFGLSRAHPAYEGDDAYERWSAAVAAIPFLNELDLDYPTYGFNLFSPTVNSNSAYRTFGEIMGIPVHDFPGAVGPGLANRMIALEEIERLRFQAASSTA
jgi:hypothetical protein